MKMPASAAALAAALSVTAPARAETPGPAHPDWMAAHFIDVGQGQAILLEFSCGVALVDTGGEADGHVDGNARLMAYLAKVFATRPDLPKAIDVVFLTHAHGDHTSGATVAKKTSATTPQTPGLVPPSGAPPYVIRNVVTNAETTGSGSKAQNALNAYAQDHGLPSLQVRVQDIPKPQGLEGAVVDPVRCASGPSPRFRVLWGSSHEGRGWEGNGNNHSLVIRLDFGRSSFLFPGDLEETAQPSLLAAYAADPSLLDVDVLNVPHHGSKNGTTVALLRATTPKIAVISSGDPSKAWSGLTARDFGHPNVQALKLLQDPVIGVTWKRPAKTRPVGISGKNPSTHAAAKWGTAKITGAVYDTGWDGDIVIEAAATGEEIIRTAHP